MVPDFIRAKPYPHTLKMGVGNPKFHTPIPLFCKNTTLPQCFIGTSVFIGVGDKNRGGQVTNIMWGKVGGRGVPFPFP